MIGDDAINAENLRNRLSFADAYLRSLGLHAVTRPKDDTAIIVAERKDMARLIASPTLRDMVIKEFTGLGFAGVALDLDNYI